MVFINSNIILIILMKINIMRINTNLNYIVSDVADTYELLISLNLNVLTVVNVIDKY